MTVDNRPDPSADAARTPPGSIRVSVVLATYNRAHYLPVALESLLNQSRAPDEIIVVDDGSSDMTADVVARYGSRVRYSRLPENRGRPAALNEGIALARGTHIWVFDDDDVALPDALRSHVEFLTTHPEIDFSYSSNYVFAGDGDIWQRLKWKPKYLPPWPVDEFFIQHAMHMHALMQGMLIPKRCFDAVGYFDSALFRSQDDEMVLRLAHRFRAANLQKATFVLREHGGERGPQAARHPASRQTAVWLQYGHRIYRKAYDLYPLAAYLPHVPCANPPGIDEADKGRALLQRGAIMLRHGLTDEALADMQAAFPILDRSAASTAWLHPLLAAGFDVDSSRLVHPLAFVFKLRKLLGSTRLPDASKSIRQGIYWAFRRGLRQRRWRDALRSATMLAIIASPV